MPHIHGEKRGREKGTDLFSCYFIGRFSVGDVVAKFKKEHVIMLKSIDSKVQILMESVIVLGHKLDAMRSH